MRATMEPMPIIARKDTIKTSHFVCSIKNCTVCEHQSNSDQCKIRQSLEENSYVVDKDRMYVEYLDDIVKDMKKN